MYPIVSPLQNNRECQLSLISLVSISFLFYINAHQRGCCQNIVVCGRLLDYYILVILCQVEIPGGEMDPGSGRCSSQEHLCQLMIHIDTEGHHLHHGAHPGIDGRLAVWVTRSHNFPRFTLPRGTGHWLAGLLKVRPSAGVKGNFHFPPDRFLKPCPIITVWNRLSTITILNFITNQIQNQISNLVYNNSCIHTGNTWWSRYGGMQTKVVDWPKWAVDSKKSNSL